MRCFLSVIFLIVISLILGCSGKSNPVEPSHPGTSDSLSVPGSTDVHIGANSNLLGTFTATFNPETLTTEVTQNRTLSSHYNVTSWIDPPLININSWDPVTETIDVDVVIHNPYMVDAYDLRLIIYTDGAGHLLTNDDNWTPLFDIPGGYNINPFKAFAKNKPNRVFARQAWEQENLLIRCPGNNYIVQFAIEASYPGNCEEPYDISNFQQGILHNQTGATADVSITVMDWQDDVQSVMFFCNDVLGGFPISLTESGTNLWGGEIQNNTGADIGEYNGYVAASSLNSGQLKLYGEFYLRVTDPTQHGWAETDFFGDSEYREIMDMCIDGSQYIYTCGYGGGGPCIVKFDNTGTLIWSRVWTVSSDGADLAKCESRGITVDDSGNIYIVGTFAGIVDFDPGPDEDIRTTTTYVAYGTPGQPEYYNDEAFISKYDSTGNYCWTRTWGGRPDYGMGQGKSSLCSDVVTDSNGDIILTGFYSTAANYFDLDPGPYEDRREPEGYNLSRYDSEGAYLGSRVFLGYWLHEVRIYIDINDAGELFLTGGFFGVFDFDPGPGVEEMISNGGHDVFLGKYSNIGDLIWVHSWGGEERDYAKTVHVDCSGNVLVGGTFREIVDFDPGPGEVLRSAIGYDIFLSKFSTDGNLRWVNTWGGNATTNSAESISSSPNGDVFVSGDYGYTVDFDPSSGEDLHIAADIHDFYLSSFDTNGSYRWARTWGALHIDEALAVASDADSNVYMAGNFWKTIDFDPGPGIDEHTPPPSLTWDGYLMKLLPNGYWY